MRKLLCVLLVLTACGRSPSPSTTPSPSSGGYGTESPRAAVEAFLSGVRAGDLQAISAVWGNEDGPVFEREDRRTLEQRELIMICYFKHDSARVLDQVASGTPNRPSFRVELKRGSITRTPTFTVARGPRGRWFVADADVTAVSDLCNAGQPTQPPPPPAS